MNGNAPHILALVMPRNISGKSSELIFDFFCKISLCVNKKSTKKASSHLQKARDIGGILIPPLATIKLLDIKIGCIISKEKCKKLFLRLDTTVKKIIIFYRRKPRRPSCQ